MNTYIWVVGITNQLFITGSLPEKNNNNKVVTDKIPFLQIGPFCTPLYLVEHFCMVILRFDS